MKMKLYDRLALYVISVLAVAVGMLVFLVPILFGAAITSPMNYIYYGCGVVMVILGAYLFLIPGRYRDNRKDYIVQQNENGPMRISVGAVEDLVSKCVDTHEEVKDAKIYIRNERDEVSVDLNVSLPSNISIPLAVEALQKHVKNYLKASSGIEAKEVRISVNTTKGEIGSENALDIQHPEIKTMQEEVKTEEEASAEDLEKKKPLHRRLFGRSKEETEEETPAAEETAAETPAEAPVQSEPTNNEEDK